jgi:hypothetical protein
MAGAVTFTLPDHLSPGSEAANTWYYCYVSPDGTSLEPHISSQQPVSGYHPAPNDDWRHVGTFRNDGSTNIVPFQAYRTPQGWEYAYTRAHDPNDPAMNQIGLGTDPVSTFALLPMAPYVPPTARQVLARTKLTGNGSSVFLAHPRHAGTSSLRAYAVVVADDLIDFGTSTSMSVGWVELDALQRIARGQTATQNGGAWLEILGWREEM